MTQSSAQVFVDPNRTIAEISPLLFGGFVEHMGRCVYEGIYDPKSKHADEDGLRKDVLAALREQKYTTIRYPGGNMLSGYNWLDGVGPKAQRPRRRELAWQSIETNQFGTNEFMGFCKAIDAAPMLGVNMGTGTIQAAADLVEYCNSPVGTYCSDLRASPRLPRAPRRALLVRGQRDGRPLADRPPGRRDYGAKALEAAKMMKWMDPTIETVLCGSSNDRMPTYPEWDRVALEVHLGAHGLPLHPLLCGQPGERHGQLPGQRGPVRGVRGHDGRRPALREGQTAQQARCLSLLGRVAGLVQGRPHQGDWTEAPHLAEESYNLEDALVVAQWLNVFLRKSHVLKIACVAQIVNIISWLNTRGDGLLKQTSFYPFKLVSNYARGQALDVLVKAPTVETAQYGAVPVLDVSACYDASQRGRRHLPGQSQPDRRRDHRTGLAGQAPASDPRGLAVGGHGCQGGQHLGESEPDHRPAIAAPKIVDGKATVQLPPLSFTVLRRRRASILTRLRPFSYGKGRRRFSTTAQEILMNLPTFPGRPWDFQIDPSDGADVSAITTWRTAQVPLPWQAQFDDLRLTSGTAWYRRAFTWQGAVGSKFAAENAAILHFGAVDYYATVWLNGEHRRA